MIFKKLPTEQKVSFADIIRDAKLSAIIASRDYHSLAEFIRSGSDQETISQNPSTSRDRGRGSRVKNKRFNKINSREINQNNTFETSERSSTSARTTGNKCGEKMGKWKYLLVRKLQLGIVCIWKIKKQKEARKMCT